MAAMTSLLACVGITVEWDGVLTHMAAVSTHIFYSFSLPERTKGVARGWGPGVPVTPFCKPFCKQATYNIQVIIWWVTSVWVSVTPPLKNHGYAHANSVFSQFQSNLNSTFWSSTTNRSFLVGWASRGILWIRREKISVFHHSQCAILFSLFWSISRKDGLESVLSFQDVSKRFTSGVTDKFRLFFWRKRTLLQH